jgi:hypothetical protein
MEQTGQVVAPISCPRHNATDHVRHVPVAWAEDTVSLLSPRPVLKAADRLAWAGTGLGVAGMISVWFGNVVGGGTVGISLIAAAPCFAYALALYGLAALRRARFARVERGMPSAMAVWGTALYCDRCQGVFFPPGSFAPDAGPSGAGGVQQARGLMTAADFQRLVWSAGGYGDLRPAHRELGPARPDLHPAG